MIFLCEQEAQVCILQHLRILLRLKHQIDTECLKAIGGSAFARSGSVSVLGNCHTCRCSYDCCSSRNIKCIRTVSTGSDDINHIHIATVKLRCETAHTFGAGRNLFGCLPFHMQGYQKCCDL